jgi:hypothetical protein
MKRGLKLLAALGVALSGLAVWSLAQPPGFTISSTIPGNYTGNNLTSAATFAWQEFIALNWPNQNNNGTVTQRGTPSQQPLGTPNVPLVWHTYRGKVEIFPGTGAPNGYNPQAPDYGFSAPPAYNYQVAVNPCGGGKPPSTPAWINLDETTQIGLDAMYAGALAKYKPPYLNTAPQLIRFLAKANQTQYVYIAQPHPSISGINPWYSGVPQSTKNATLAFLASNLADPPPGSKTMVSFPLNTIEIKAAFRPLAPGEDPSRFYVTKVRYYEQPSKNSYCYVEDNWALVALHIIQKTANSPFFVYATFEQADNILTTGGKPTEDLNGKLIVPNPGGLTTNPRLSFKDSNQAFAKTPIYPTVSTVPANAPYCPSTISGQPNSQLYYQELGDFVPKGGSICQAFRNNLIPPEVIAVNSAAHSAIAQYTKQHGVTSPFGYYKLINVQALPINKTTPGVPYNGLDRASYYQSNSVVETDYTLQMFSTAIFGATAGFGPPTDYNVAGSQNPEPAFSNTYFGGKAYAMGGCMGCHGNAQVGAGTDFSFITAGGRVASPQTPAAADVALARQTYRRIFTSRPLP